MASGGGVRQRHPGHGARDTHGFLYRRQIHGMDDGRKPISAQGPSGAVAALTVNDLLSRSIPVVKLRRRPMSVAGRRAAQEIDWRCKALTSVDDLIETKWRA